MLWTQQGSGRYPGKGQRNIVKYSTLERLALPNHDDKRKVGLFQINDLEGLRGPRYAASFDKADR